MIAVGVGNLVVLVVNYHWDVFEHYGKIVLAHVLQPRFILLLFLKLLEADEVDDGEDGEGEVQQIEYLFSLNVVVAFKVVSRERHSAKISSLFLHDVRAVVAVHADVQVIEIEDDEPHRQINYDHLNEAEVHRHSQRKL